MSKLSKYKIPKCSSWILCITLLCSTFQLFSQTYHFKTYSLDEGLIQSQVLTICQDKRGYLWVGTFGGVSRFDGNEFKNYSVNDGLSNNVVYKVLADQHDNIWIGTMGGGVSVLHADTFIVYDTDDRLSSNSVFDIYEDSKGNIWVATMHGLNKIIYDSKITGRQIQNYSDKHGFQVNDFHGIYEDEHENIWVATVGSGVYKFDLNNPKVDSTTLTNYTVKDGLLSRYTYCINGDSKGNVWIGTHTGVSMYDGEQFTNYSSTDGLNGSMVWSIFEDKNNTIWVSTLNGNVNLFENGHLTSFSDQDGIGSRGIYSVFQDIEENLWFATDGDGLKRFSGKRFTNITVHYGKPDLAVWSIDVDENHAWIGTYENGLLKLNMNEGEGVKKIENIADLITSVFKDKNGDVWVGTYLEGLLKLGNDKVTQRFTTEKGLPGNQIWALEQDHDGNLWVGTNGGVYVFDPDEFEGVSPAKFDLKKFKFYSDTNGLNNNEIRTILVDKNNTVWIGIYEFGVHKLQDDKFTIFNTENGLSNNTAESLCDDSKGNIWIGTYGGGVNLLYVKTNEIEVFTTKDGLVDDAILFVHIDRSDQLWIGTNRGLSRMDINYFYETGEKKFKNYSKEEGFFGVECNPSAVYEDAEGGIRFGTIKGAFRYDPKADRINKVEPHLHLTGLRLFFEQFNFSDYATEINENNLPANLILPYDQNHLTFDFTGISLTIPEKVQYQYKLDGLDQEWSPSLGERSATYSNIPPGEYIFYIKASNNDGLWNENPLEFSFTITPPFWQTAWFYGLCIMGGLTIVISFIKIREKKLQQEKKRLEAMVDERTIELKKEKEKVEEINKELEKLSIVASETDNSVIITDKNGEIQWVNEGFEKMTGYKIDEFKLAIGSTLIEGSSNPEFSQLLNECVKKRESLVYESINETKEGNKFWVQSTLTPILDDAGEVKKLVVIDTDITKRKLTELDLKNKNKSILESINYAQRIQETIMPTTQHLQKYFPDSFIYYKAKDVVSGDFPWTLQNDNNFYVAAVDCTGHGVPGAMMSMIGYFLLNDIVGGRHIHEPGEILNKLHEGIKNTLNQEENLESKDGMDIALCTINRESREVQFAGAHRPLLWLHNGEIQQIKGNRFPVGGLQYSSRGKEINFTTNKLTLDIGDSIFFFSDGLIDQIGGPKNRNFKSTQIVKIIDENKDLEMNEISKIIDDRFNEWMGPNKQTDDVIMIGIRM
ncbi:MAG: SpoIIE family protein phosphatase [Bacteroidia bacterium]|nr:SpoIIE family protein phosphatase [Bacteroidia bacterium]